MATIDQTYRENLRLLVAQEGGVTKFAERIGKSASQVSQWLNASADSKTGKPRALSRAMARYIEGKCGKLEGWMDQPQGKPQAAEPTQKEVSGRPIEMPPVGQNKGDFIRVMTAEERELMAKVLDYFRNMHASDAADMLKKLAELSERGKADLEAMMRKAGMDKIREGAAHAVRGGTARSSVGSRLSVKVVDPAAPELPGIPPPTPEEPE